MRLKPFDVKMYYYKRSRLSNVEEAVCGFRYTRLDDMLAHCESSSWSTLNARDRRPLRP